MTEFNLRTRQTAQLIPNSV